MEGLERLLAERDIRDVVLRYCRGVDRMDRALVRSCYHDDATDTHGSFTGGVDAFVEWVWRLLARYDTTMHFVGNMLVEIADDADDAARCETYGIAFHRTENAGADANLTTGFRFVDDFRRRDGVWRIQRRIAVTEWVRADRPDQHWPIPAAMLRGGRDGTDVVQRRHE